MVAVTVAFIGAISNNHSESPLTAVQLLWLNLIMDTFAALALATQTPSQQLLKYKPYAHDEALISKVMWRNIWGQYVYQMIICMGILYIGPSWFQVDDRSDTHITILFNTFVWCQLFNSFNARKIHNQINVFEGVTSNPMFFLITAFEILMQCLIVEFGGSFTSTTHLTISQWFICIALGSISIPWFVLVSALIPVRDTAMREEDDIVNKTITLHRTPSKNTTVTSDQSPRTPRSNNGHAHNEHHQQHEEGQPNTKNTSIKQDENTAHIVVESNNSTVAIDIHTTGNVTK